MLVHMGFQGLNRDERRIFAVRECAGYTSCMRNLVFSEKLFGLEAHCGARARVESTCVGRSPELTLEEIQLLGGDSWIVMLLEEKPDYLLIRC
jgi:hypothetical protein